MFIIIAITTVFEHYCKSNNNNMKDLLLYKNFNNYFISLCRPMSFTLSLPARSSVPTNIFYASIFSHLLYDQPINILVPANFETPCKQYKL